MSARRLHVTRQAGYRGLVHQPLTSGTRGHFSAFASSNASLNLTDTSLDHMSNASCVGHGSPSDQSQACNLQYPSSFNAGTRLQYAVLSITDNHVVLVAQNKPNHACFLVHQQLGVAPVPSLSTLCRCNGAAWQIASGVLFHPASCSTVCSTRTSMERTMVRSTVCWWSLFSGLMP